MPLCFTSKALGVSQPAVLTTNKALEWAKYPLFLVISAFSGVNGLTCFGEYNHTQPPKTRVNAGKFLKW